MTKIEFYDPCGRVDAAQTHAPRLESLAGKKIGFVSNSQWQTHRMLPLLKSWLERDFPDADVLPVDRFPQGTALIGNEQTTDLVAASGVDAVIIGNAA